MRLNVATIRASKNVVVDDDIIDSHSLKPFEAMNCQLKFSFKLFPYFFCVSLDRKIGKEISLFLFTSFTKSSVIRT